MFRATLSSAVSLCLKQIKIIVLWIKEDPVSLIICRIAASVIREYPENRPVSHFVSVGQHTVSHTQKHTLICAQGFSCTEEYLVPYKEV